jgi:hypothetical protein
VFGQVALAHDVLEPNGITLSEEDRLDVGSAINNAVSRIAGLMAIALIGVVATGTLDYDSFLRLATRKVVVVRGSQRAQRANTRIEFVCQYHRSFHR